MEELKAINIIKEYFCMESVEKAKELFETCKERFTDNVLEEMDRDNFKTECLRKDPRRNRGCR